MSADRADEEDLKTTSFSKGEWGDDLIALGMDYDMVAEALGTAAAPMAAAAPLTLVAIAFVTGGLDQALTGRPDDLLTKWEAAITARGAQAAGGDAANNARANALANATSEVERMAVRLVEAKDGVMQLVTPLRELPLVQMNAMNIQPFKRLARLADAHGAMPTASIRSLATRLGVTLPDDNDSSEVARAKWVWQLAVLERSITTRALGYLKAAQADGKWDEAVAALSDTGRFSVPWMAALRAAKQAAAEAAAAAAAAGRGFENIPILDIFTHVTTTLPAADVNALAKQFAYATAGVHGVTLAGTHVRRVEECVWNGSAASDEGAKPRCGQAAGDTGDDTERAFSAAALHDADGRRRWSSPAGRKPGTGGAGGDDGAGHGVGVVR